MTAQSPLPELSHLLRHASSCAAPLGNGNQLDAEQRRALTDLIGFIREYDQPILDWLDAPPAS